MDLSSTINCQQLSYLVLEGHHNLLLICDVEEPSKCDFLILHTVMEQEEVQIISKLAQSVKAQQCTDIVLYGLDSQVETLTSLLAKQKRIRALGFSRVFLYLGGLYLWIANWTFFSRDQFPIRLLPSLQTDLQNQRRLAPTEQDSQEVWDNWLRYLGTRLVLQQGPPAPRRSCS
jgi:hypothetical protein